MLYWYHRDAKSANYVHFFVQLSFFLVFQIMNARSIILISECYIFNEIVSISAASSILISQNE